MVHTIFFLAKNKIFFLAKKKIFLAKKKIFLLAKKKISFLARPRLLGAVSGPAGIDSPSPVIISGAAWPGFYRPAIFWGPARPGPVPSRTE